MFSPTTLVRGNSTGVNFAAENMHHHALMCLSPDVGTKIIMLHGEFEKMCEKTLCHTFATIGVTANICGYALQITFHNLATSFETAWLLIYSWFRFQLYKPASTPLQPVRQHDSPRLLQHHTLSAAGYSPRCGIRWHQRPQPRSPSSSHQM